MVSRRSMLIALPAALGWQGLAGHLRATMGGAAKRVAVVFPSDLEPCREAVEGLRLRLSGNELVLAFLDSNKATFDTDAAQERARRAPLIVAVGSEALRAMLEQESPARIVSTMTLASDGTAASKAGRVSAAVYLDIPVRTLIAESRKLFPEKTRVGVILNPGRRGDTASQIRSQAPEPVSLEIAECAKADELLPVFLAFRKKVDLVICLPDGSLYNSATARTLIMASLENRLPIIGFSPAFLRSGAAVAVYPDYRGVGQQTADLVRRCLQSGDCTNWETPRKVDVAVNAKVLRMLGMEYKAAANPELVILR